MCSFGKKFVFFRQEPGKRLDIRIISRYISYRMDHNYLDIYPSNSIARQIDEEPLDHRWYDQLVAHATAYLKVMEHENLDFLESRQGPTIDSGDTYKFLRSQERTRNTKLILQYLITFLSNLPLEEDIAGKPVNPFVQLKTFILYNVDVIKDADVSNAILKEHEKLGLLNDTNSWYYRGQIDKNHKSIRDLVEQVTAPTLEGYLDLFHALKRLCAFWFSVRNEEPNRVRRSDVMMYKLLRLLLAKYKKKTADKKEKK